MAELKTGSGGDVSVSYRTKARWNQQEGIWISKDKVLFPVPAVTSNQTVTFTDLPGGTYTMNWCLVYGKDPRGNIAGNKVSNTASFTYTNTVLTDRPLLDVVLNPKVDSYVIPQGTQTKLQFHLETSCNQSETDKVVSITIEKQGTLCNFVPVDDKQSLASWYGKVHLSIRQLHLQERMLLHSHQLLHQEPTGSVSPWIRTQQKTTYTLHSL